MTITTEFVSFVVFILGAVAAAWWRVEGVVRVAKDESMSAARSAAAEAAKVGEKLATYKTHVAETYLTKAGLREQMEPLFDAVKGISGQVQHMNERLDRVIEGQPTARKAGGAN